MHQQTQELEINFSSFRRDHQLDPAAQSQPLDIKYSANNYVDRLQIQGRYQVKDFKVNRLCNQTRESCSSNKVCQVKVRYYSHTNSLLSDSVNVLNHLFIYTGMQQNYYNQSSMGGQGQPVPGGGPPGGGGPGPGMMPPQQQQQMNSMMGQRGPGPAQEMGGFMPGGPQAAGQMRAMGQRPPGFMQGNQGGPGNPMNPMQANQYRRPINQMVQQGQMGGPGQMGSQATGQMGQPVHGQMVQGMQNQQMVQGGMGGPMNPNMVQGQMGQPGMQNPGMVPDQQRMRQFAMQQQQQSHQQQPGMGMGPRMHFSNQQGSFQ